MAVKHDYSANMRRALYEGLIAAAKEKDMTLTEYCTAWWHEDWKAAANTMAKFAPRETKVTGSVKHDHEHKHTVTETQSFIASVLGEDQAEETRH